MLALDDEQKEKMMMIICNGDNGDVNVTVSGGRGKGAHACPNQPAHQLSNKTERYVHLRHVGLLLLNNPTKESKLTSHTSSRWARSPSVARNSLAIAQSGRSTHHTNTLTLLAAHSTIFLTSKTHCLERSSRCRRLQFCF